MSRFAVRGARSDPGVTPAWWWKVVRLDGPHHPDDSDVYAGVATWEEAMHFAREYAHEEACIDAGVCPFSDETLVQCQVTDLCDCFLPRVEGPVDNVHPCGHRVIEPGCGGCDPGAGETSLSDEAVNLLALLTWRSS